MNIYNRTKITHFLTLASLPTEVIKLVNADEAAFCCVMLIGNGSISAGLMVPNFHILALQPPAFTHDPELTSKHGNVVIYI